MYSHKQIRTFEFQLQLLPVISRMGAQLKVVSATRSDQRLKSCTAWNWSPRSSASPRNSGSPPFILFDHSFRLCFMFQRLGCRAHVLLGGLGKS